MGSTPSSRRCRGKRVWSPSDALQAEARSVARTSCPALSKISTMWLPIKPHAPVTNETGFFAICCIPPPFKRWALFEKVGFDSAAARCRPSSDINLSDIDPHQPADNWSYLFSLRSVNRNPGPSEVLTRTYDAMCRTFAEAQTSGLCLSWRQCTPLQGISKPRQDTFWKPQSGGRGPSAA